MELLARNWWTLALRGAFAVLFGVVAWIWPAITVWALMILFGAYALVDGAFGLIAAISGRGGTQSRGWLAVAGITGIILGLLALAWPGITALALLVLIAAWAIITGVSEIVAAVALRHEIQGEWLYVAAGAVSVLFGVLLLVWPKAGGLTLVWLIGLFSILFGAVLIGAAFRLRAFGEAAAGAHRKGAGVRPH